MSNRPQFIETLHGGHINMAYIRRVSWDGRNYYLIEDDETKHTISDEAYMELVYGNTTKTLLPMVGAGYQLIVLDQDKHDVFPVLALIVDVDAITGLDEMKFITPCGQHSSDSVGVMYPDGRVEGSDGTAYANKDDFLAGMAKRAVRIREKCEAAAE